MCTRSRCCELGCSFEQHTDFMGKLPCGAEYPQTGVPSLAPWTPGLGPSLQGIPGTVGASLASRFNLTTIAQSDPGAVEGSHSQQDPTLDSASPTPGKSRKLFSPSQYWLLVSAVLYF